MIDCLKDCPELGACCKGFFLGPVEYGTTDEEFDSLMEKHKAPFKKIDSNDPKRSPVCYCPVLGADGLCTDYENRPETCRIYHPGVEALCVLFVGPPTEGVMVAMNREDVRMLKCSVMPGKEANNG